MRCCQRCLRLLKLLKYLDLGAVVHTDGRGTCDRHDDSCTKMTRNSVSSLWRSSVGDRHRERVMVNASTVLTVTLLEVLST